MMKSKIETNDCIDDLLADSRHAVGKTFLREARSKGLRLIDENVVIFSHQSMTTVAAPFAVDGEEMNKNQSLIYLYFKGPSGTDMEDGFYTIQGNLDKSGINEKNLIMLNSAGKVVQELDIAHVEDEDGPSETYDRNDIEITDSHYKKTKNGAKGKVSGTIKGRQFVATWSYSVKVKVK